jgi:hypothetical protein
LRISVLQPVGLVRIKDQVHALKASNSQNTRTSSTPIL